MLRKKTGAANRSTRPSPVLSRVAGTKVDRRTFLRGSGLAVGGLAAFSAGVGRVTPAAAQAANGRVEVVKEAVTDRCHLSVLVSNFEKAVASLEARGVALEEPLKTPPGIKAVFLKEPDPAGTLVHLFWTA